MPHTKLEIIGPYTPEHEGPFCTREGKPVELKIRDGRGCYAAYGYIGDEQSISAWTADGKIIYDSKTQSPHDLMNAEEVPEAREFWINEYRRADGSKGTSYTHETEHEAVRERYELPNWDWVRTIRVREVLPGEE